MKFKKIELHGFKSFKDKINLGFDHPITAIVGPNGSGKSNIADAIRWVLGEQSAKSLRGNKMEDIIFAGTEKIKPVNVARVSISFDNEDHWLPVDFKEVSIERRVYRNGDSNYYINQGKCKMKDIKELFLDTGVGKDGYSIIGQGRVDSILNSKSEDRREIFEEASGISKLKYKKLESLKKLDRTKANMKTVQEILTLKNTELVYLKKEADKAYKGIELQKKLREKEIDLAKSDIHELKKVKDRNELEWLKSTDELNSLIEQRSEVTNGLNNVRDELDELKIILESQDIEMQKLKLEIQENQSNLVLNKEKEKNTKENLERIIKSLEIIETEIVQVQDNIERQSRDKKDKKIHLISIQKEYETQKSSYNILKERKNHIQSEYDEILRIYDERKREFDKLTAKKEASQELSEKEEEFILESESKKQNFKEDILQNKRESLALQDHIVKIQNKINIHNEKKIYLEDSLEKDHRKVQEMDALKTSLHIQLKDLMNRVKMQNQIKENFEGYYRQVAIFLKEIQKEKIKDKVHGTLAELINIDDKFEKVIEVLLGANLQSIITQSDQDAKDLVQFLKDRRIGRLTFLPIESIKPKKSTVESKDPDILSIASRVVHCDEQYRGIVEYFLNRTLIVKDMEKAILVKKRNPYHRIATIDADLINTWGSIVGGYKKDSMKGSSIVNRDKEIENLNQNINRKNKEIERLIEDFNSLKSQIASNEKKLVEINSTLENLMDEKESSSRQKELFDIKIEVLLGKEEEFQEYINKRSEHSFSNEDREKLNNLSEKLPLEREDLNLKNDELHALEEEIKEMEIDLYKKDSQNESEKRDYYILENEWNKSKEKLEDLLIRKEEELQGKANFNLQIKDFEIKNNDIENLIHSLGQRYEKSKKENPILKEKRENLEQLKDELSSNLREIEKNIIQFEYKTDNYKKDIQKIEDELTNIKKIIFDEYEERLDECNFDEFVIVDNKKYRKDIKEMKKILYQIGEYRRESIGEYELLNSDIEETNKQKEDLLSTADNLEKIIKNLNINMTKSFQQAFIEINKNFNRIFRILFNGGSASLVIEEEDILNTGIEIIAEPPGKKLQNLNLLSGGERSLTAVALLFAIFENRPSPFCILDEIDAALDEANIYRYTKYLKELSENTQFIMITHRKSTMEIAHVLYGVSMQKEGISNIITLDLK